MNKWFKVTVTVSEVEESLAIKKSKKQYLIEAVSFADAEKRTIEELSHYFKAMEIERIDPEKISEIFTSKAGEKFFKCKVNFITLNEKTLKEQKTPYFYYVMSNGTEDAGKTLNERMKGTISDWACESIAETKIQEAFIAKDSNECSTSE